MTTSNKCSEKERLINDMVDTIRILHSGKFIISIDGLLKSIAFIYLGRMARVRLAWEILKTAITNEP